MSEFPHYKTLQLRQAAKVSRNLYYISSISLETEVSLFYGLSPFGKKASQECSGAATAFVSRSQPFFMRRIAGKAPLGKRVVPSRFYLAPLVYKTAFCVASHSGFAFAEHFFHTRLILFIGMKGGLKSFMSFYIYFLLRPW
jgi:hypothetical protein